MKKTILILAIIAGLLMLPIPAPAQECCPDKEACKEQLEKCRVGRMNSDVAKAACEFQLGDCLKKCKACTVKDAIKDRGVQTAIVFIVVSIATGITGAIIQAQSR
jgi:hypothetical protein